MFVHGLIMDNLSSFYYTLAPGVARSTDVVLYDLRGHGRSDRPSVGYRVEDGVADLLGILDALPVDGPVHVVGNSFGGTIALAAALRHPERIAGMVLIEAHPAFEGWASMSTMPAMRSGWRRAAAGAMVCPADVHRIVDGQGVEDAEQVRDAILDAVADRRPRSLRPWPRRS